ncbi:hypothetical protein F4556_005073 [Kitasatospora gansuensis]|uniref:Uncharacterized protein n=1 Tax=Kitasatospora gansuensis TaxID=258050 RepID=A0A7W7SGJ2_9ACTN|nr:hypothetical protein [Kitasatospora gansuensis]MBB4949538.1 hypothetical protein [Kitasatospora gansuensis]
MTPPNHLVLAPWYSPIVDLARHRGVTFHIATSRQHASLHLHLPDGSLLAITDDGVGGATARKPSGTTGWKAIRTLPTGHRTALYDSTLLGRYHHLGTDPDPLLGVLARYLPPPPAMPDPRTRRSHLLRRLLRLT